MQTLWTLIAFLLGYGLCAVTALASARRSGFWVGWEAREKYPASALSRTPEEVSKILAEEEERIMN